MMNLDKFNGIVTYHDGDAVSDYVNMIPMEFSSIDRLGEKLLYYKGETPRGSFVDSLGNIYIVYGGEVHRFTQTASGVNHMGKLSMRVGNVVSPLATLLNTTGKVTFTESSVKPTTVYLCDGTYIYQWDTFNRDQILSDNRPYLKPYVIRMLPSPNVMVTGYNPNDSMYRAYCDDFDQYELLTDQNSNLHNLINSSERANITSISWFDNKLIATQSEKNTVWVSSTDPQQYFRYRKLDGTYDSVTVGNQPGEPDEDWLVPIRSQWDMDGLDSNLWYNFYSSTNTADRLNTAIGYAGQLWLLNEGTIEVWSRTGDEDAPLAPNSLNTIYHGGRSPLIISNTLFIICKDQLGHEFVGTIVGNTFTRLSNPEIEKRFNNNIYDLVPLLIREETFVLARLGDTDGKPYGDGYVVGMTGKWWRWYNPDHTKDFAMWSINKNVVMSNKGSLLQFDRESRTLYDGTPIIRYVRDWFQFFNARTICRSVELVADSGISFSSDGDKEKRQRSVYCKVSFNRGHTFGPVLYRHFGKGGQNDNVVIWRNLGSGNSLLLEFGTSSNYQFQIYKIVIDLK